MAKTPKIFVHHEGLGPSATYTVPSGKYAVAHAYVSDQQTYFEINGKAMRPSGAANVAGSLSGLVLPAGTTFRAQGTYSTATAIASGFEYDV